MPHSNNLCYDFGPYRMNATQRVLTRDGTSIPLTPKTTDILLVLLQNSGELVDKEVLLSEVWPETFVEESNLTQYIFRLRQVIKDQRTPAQYIETIPGRGYRFIAPVKVLEIPSPADQAAQALSALGRSDAPPRIAVIPFLNETGDDTFEYLSDGISENLINSLSQISTLRVMSRTAVMRFKGKQIEPKRLAIDLRVDAVLLGKIVSTPSGLVMNVELVDAGNGWQLWGRSFACELSEIVEIQQEVVRQVSIGLRLRLTGDEEKRISARYTDNPQAYQAYLEGRFFWSLYTRRGVEQAIERFGQSINIDNNYALAYVAIIDCYLRLLTDYFPPQRTLGATFSDSTNQKQTKSIVSVADENIRLRYEWDLKGAERELRRGMDIKLVYPSAHQWHAAYLLVRKLYQESRNRAKEVRKEIVSHRVVSVDLVSDEEVQIMCSIAREQVDVGNYEAACLVLKKWWHFGTWPKSLGLDSRAHAELLFTTGELSGFLASANQIANGQKHAEHLLSGSIALFEHHGAFIRSAEARNELGLCYYRQGRFDLGRSTFLEVLSTLPPEETTLRGLALIRLASLERHAGRFDDALSLLIDADAATGGGGPWISGRRHLELASTLKELGLSDHNEELLQQSLNHHESSLLQFQAVGHWRLAGIAQNNLGFLLMIMNRLSSSKTNLLRSRRIFEALNDKVRLAQVEDSLARLYLKQGRNSLAEKCATRALEIVECGDEDVLLSEALRTQGKVLAVSGRKIEAIKVLERAHDIAARCGDKEGAGLALLIVIEELREHLDQEEKKKIVQRLAVLVASSEHVSFRDRVKKISSQHDS